MIILNNVGLLGACLIGPIALIGGASYVIRFILERIILPLAIAMLEIGTSLVLLVIKIVYLVAIVLIPIPLGFCLCILSNILEFFGMENADEYIEEKIIKRLFKF